MIQNSDESGENLIYYDTELAPDTVFCPGCGHVIAPDSILNKKSSRCKSDDFLALLDFTEVLSRSTDLVAFRGVHNFEAKLLSPFLTRYGMDKESGQPRLLYDMNLGATFDCGQLGNKVFRICRRDLLQPGVGEPNELNGYLAGTLIKIDEASNQVKSAIPGHADPDGHCLG